MNYRAVIMCKSADEAKRVLSVLHEEGVCWGDGSEIIDDASYIHASLQGGVTYWVTDKEYLCWGVLDWKKETDSCDTFTDDVFIGSGYEYIASKDAAEMCETCHEDVESAIMDMYGKR